MFKPNEMQQKVLDSKKRVIVITAQAGSGTTTAIILKLLDEAFLHPNNLSVLVKRTSAQRQREIENFLSRYPNARYSPSSGIITVKKGSKKAKIKIVDFDSFEFDKFNHAVGIDCASQFSDLQGILNCSGKVIIGDFAVNCKEESSWALKSGLLTQDSLGKYSWDVCVDNVIGFIGDNPSITDEYKRLVYSCNPETVHRLNCVDLN